SIGGTEVLSGGVGDFDAIGRAGGSYFDGLIDDVRIYNRNLTPTEIVRQYGGLEPATYTSTQTLSAPLTVGGNLYLASGRLDVSEDNYAVNIGGQLRNDGGVLAPREG